MVKEDDGWKLSSQEPYPLTYAESNSVPQGSKNEGSTEADVDGGGGKDKLGFVESSATASPQVDDSGKEVTYGPESAVDGDPRTAWQVSGNKENEWNGENEWILLKYKKPIRISRVGLIPGYDKVDPSSGTDRFYQMHVVRKAHIKFSNGSGKTVSLERDRDMQTFDVPDTETISVRIRILDTYPPQPHSPEGSEYDFLIGRVAISEIKVE